MLTSLQTRLKRAGKLLPALLLPFAAYSQALNYGPTNAMNVAGTYTDLGTTGTAIATANNDDANSAAQAIGFTFSYNGAAFTQFVLSTNGFIKLGAAAPSAANLFLCNVAGCTNVDPVTSTNAADVNLVMPFNFDLQQGTGGAADYRVATTGTAPNRVCTVQWKNVSDKPDSAPTPTQYDNISFQAKLYETSNNIEFVYGPTTVSTAAAISRFPIVGIKGSGSANGQTVLANKTTGAAAWSTTVFITGNYTGTTHNFRNVAPPDAGRTYRFVPGAVVVTTPPNDNCATATTLTTSATCTATNSTNTNATNSPSTVPAATCGAAGPDVWFAITVPANGAVTVTTDASTATGANQLTDTVLQLYSGTCGNLVAIGCNDDTPTSAYSQVALTGLTAGSTIYARVFGFSNATGDFSICATSTTGAVCAPVTNLATSNVTTTGATVTFTAPAGAASYTVTYTAAGGTATTVTPAPTSSPITLTGLTAGTNYTVSVTTNCSGGGASTAATTTFRTLGTAYCVTGLGGSCGGNNVTAVAIATTTLNATGLTCTSGGTPAQAYTSYPATGANTASLNVGTTYPISVTTALGSSISVWVDYNHNFNYEPSEYVSLTANSATATVTGALVVPSNAVLGQTSLRIRTRTSGFPNGATDACTAFGSGETKDFTVTLRNGTGTRNEALAATVGLSPNPAHQSFQLAVPAGSLHNASATLRNALGQTVQTRQLSLPATGGNAEFNVSSLAAGVYTLMLQSGNDIVVKRVVVE